MRIRPVTGFPRLKLHTVHILNRNPIGRELRKILNYNFKCVADPICTALVPTSRDSIFQFSIIPMLSIILLSVLSGFLLSLAGLLLFPHVNVTRRQISSETPLGEKSTNTVHSFPETTLAQQSTFPQPFPQPLVPQTSGPGFPPCPPLSQIPPTFGPVQQRFGHFEEINTTNATYYIGEAVGSYRKVHQQLNRLNMWQDCAPEPQNTFPFLFTVFYRHRVRPVFLR